ncbi:MAG: hypothetical protein ACRD6X_18770, partial [Pyrinomonadaceae bacterium]
GWYIGPYRDERMLHHFGGYSGARAHISYLPDQAIGVAGFTNDSTVGLPLVNAIANFVYDRVAGHADAGPRFEAALDGARARYDVAVRDVVADHASRRNMRFALARPWSAYAGVYDNPEWGRIEIRANDDSLLFAYGPLRAMPEPLGRPDAVWIELEPGEGTDLQFRGGGTFPDSLSHQERTYSRMPKPPSRGR